MMTTLENQLYAFSLCRDKVDEPGFYQLNGPHYRTIVVMLGFWSAASYILFSSSFQKGPERGEGQAVGALLTDADLPAGKEEEVRRCLSIRLGGFQLSLSNRPA